MGLKVKSISGRRLRRTPVTADDDMVSVDAKAALAEMKRTDSPRKIVSGHFPLSWVEEGAGQWRTFTLLRHPQVRPQGRHLDRAIAALEKSDVIGVQEDFDPFCKRLESAFGWNVGERLGVNRAPRGCR